MSKTISERKQNIEVSASQRAWQPAHIEFRSRYSDCGTFVVSEKDLTLHLVGSELAGTQAKREAFAQAHPSLFRRMPSWSTALEALERASRLYRATLLPPVKADQPVDKLVAAPIKSVGRARLLRIASIFQVPVEDQGGKLVTTRKGQVVLESIIAMRAGHFLDREIWDELEQRHGWRPQSA